jgi:hypothetical protein
LLKERAKMLFNKIKDTIMAGDVNLQTAQVKLLLIEGTPYDADTENVAQIDPSKIVGDVDGYALENETLEIDAGDLVYKADNLVIPELSGPPISQVILYVVSGVNKENDILLWGQNVSYFPDGTNLSINWGTSIFELTHRTGDDFYYSGKLGLFSGEFDLINDDIRAAMVTNEGDKQTASTIGELTVLGNPVRINNPTIKDGVYNGDDAVFGSVSSGTVNAVVLMKYNSALPDDSELIAFFKEGMNLPFELGELEDGSITAAVWNNDPQQILCI